MDKAIVRIIQWKDDRKNELTFDYISYDSIDKAKKDIENWRDYLLIVKLDLIIVESVETIIG